MHRGQVSSQVYPQRGLWCIHALRGHKQCMSAPQPILRQTLPNKHLPGSHHRWLPCCSLALRHGLHCPELYPWVFLWYRMYTEYIEDRLNEREHNYAKSPCSSVHSNQSLALLSSCIWLEAVALLWCTQVYTGQHQLLHQAMVCIE